MNDIYRNRIESNLHTLDNRYDAENDIIPGAPKVTHTDWLLSDCIENLLMEVIALKKRMASLEAQRRIER